MTVDEWMLFFYASFKELVVSAAVNPSL